MRAMNWRPMPWVSSLNFSSKTIGISTMMAMLTEQKTIAHGAGGDYDSLESAEEDRGGEGVNG